MDPKRICDRLIDDLGISIACREERDSLGEYIDLIPNDLDPIEGFLVRVRIGWRSIESTFVPGTYSATLIKTMGEAEAHKKESFTAAVEESQKSGDKVNMSINGVSVNPADLMTWPKTKWASFSLRLDSPPKVIDIKDPLAMEQLVISYGGRLLEMILSFLTLEEVALVENPEGLPEGAKMRVEVNRFERNHLNRLACIRLKGAQCSICGFDFVSFFGEIGKGFIHVHHIVPISEIGDNYLINPATDLVPVCPNCHAMLHRMNPPFTIEELRKLLADHKTSNAESNQPEETID